MAACRQFNNNSNYYDPNYKKEPENAYHSSNLEKLMKLLEDNKNLYSKISTDLQTNNNINTIQKEIIQNSMLLDFEKKPPLVGRGVIRG